MDDGADPPLADGLEDALPLHAISFYWDGFEPRLECYDTVQRKVVQVGLDPAEFVVGSRKRCVGRFVGEDYHPCPHNATVTSFSQCQECAAEVYIKDQDCIFDPKCDGSLCDNEFCKRKHVLYLAFYGRMAKVGMSSAKRVGRAERLVEQGADAYAVIGTFPNRLRAREEEKKVSADLHLPQWFRQQTILSNLSDPVDRVTIAQEYERFRQVLDSREGFSVGRLEFIEGYPLEQPLSGQPQLQATAGVHIGRYVGAKGKWLVYDSRGLKAINLSDLPARSIADKYLVRSLKTNK